MSSTGGTLGRRKAQWLRASSASWAATPPSPAALGNHPRCCSPPSQPSCFGRAHRQWQTRGPLQTPPMATTATWAPTPQRGSGQVTTAALGNRPKGSKVIFHTNSWLIKHPRWEHHLLLLPRERLPLTQSQTLFPDFVCVTKSNLRAASAVQWKYLSADVLTQKLLHLQHTGASVSELNSALLCDCLKHKPAAKAGAQRDFCKHCLPQGCADCSL